MEIARVSSLLATVAIVAAHLLFSSASAVDFSVDHNLLSVPAKSEYRGSIAEYFLAGNDGDGDSAFGSEFEMDSEINRRILADTRHISYDALEKNNIPCSRRGASYYNCRPGAESNPYKRSCSAIDRCRS